MRYCALGLLFCFIFVIYHGTARAESGGADDFAVLRQDGHSRFVASPQACRLTMKSLNGSPSASAEMAISCHEGAQKRLAFNFEWHRPNYNPPKDRPRSDGKCLFSYQLDDEAIFDERWSPSAHSLVEGGYFYAVAVGPLDSPLDALIAGDISLEEISLKEFAYRLQSELFLAKIRKGKKLTVKLELDSGLEMTAEFDLSTLDKDLESMSALCKTLDLELRR